MNSLFHLLSVTLARFLELQANIKVTTSPIQLPAFSQTGNHCTQARTHARQPHTHTHTGLRSSGMWRCLTWWLVAASGPYSHSITPVTFPATYALPEVTTCTLTSPSRAFSGDESLGSRLITRSKTKSSVVATLKSTSDPRKSTVVTTIAEARPEKGNGNRKPNFCNSGTQLANTYSEV